MIKTRNFLRFGASVNENTKSISIGQLFISGLFLVTILLLRQVSKMMDPIKIGMFCDDQSIRKPHKESQISQLTIYIVGIFLPAIVIPIVELLSAYFVSSNKNLRCQKTGHFYIHPVLSYVIAFYASAMFGLLLTDTLTEAGKKSVGRLRPEFVAVCRPNLTQCAADPHSYITDIQCLDNDTREERLSFPSGHASILAYTAAVLILYMQYRLRLPSTLRFVRSFAQSLLAILAFYGGLTRVSDHKHRLDDVLVGIVIGIAGAAFTIFFITTDLLNERYQTANGEISEKEQMNYGRASRERRYTESLPLNGHKTSYGSTNGLTQTQS